MILGGHGITAWGATSDECEARSLEIIRTAQRVPRRRTARPSPSVRSGRVRRAARGGAAGPGGRAVPAAARPGLDRPPQVGHFTDSAAVLDFLAGAKCAPRWPRSARRAPTTSCAPRSGRCCSTCRRTRRWTRSKDRLRELHAAYREDYRAYYERNADARLARRCAAPTRRSSWCPASGMFCFGANKQTARVAGEFYVNAINVMRGAEAVSDLRADRRRRRSSASSTGRSRRPSCSACPSPSRWRAGSRSSPAAGRASAGPSPIGSRPRAPASSSPTATRRRGRDGGREIGGTRRGCRGGRRRDRRGAVEAAVRRGRARLRRRRPGRQQRRAVHLQAAARDHARADWDLQHDVMARGSFLVVTARPRGDGRAGRGRRHRLHLQQERGLRRAEQRRLRRRQGRPGAPGPAAGRRARRARRAGQRHQPRRRRTRVRHLRRRLGRQPGGGLRRAEEDLGAFYAQRTLLKREVLPEHVADAVFALTGGELSQTTGLHIPVDAGVAAAFLAMTPDRPAAAAVRRTARRRMRSGSRRGGPGSASSPAASAPTGRSSPTCCPSCSSRRQRVSERMQQLDCDVIDVGFISDAQDGARAAEQLREAGCDLIVGFLTTYMTATMLLPIAQRSGAPVLVINLQPTEVDGPRDLRHGGVAGLLRRLPAAGDRQHVPAGRRRLPFGVWLSRGGPGLGEDQPLGQGGRHPRRVAARPARLPWATSTPACSTSRPTSRWSPSHLGGHMEVVEFDDLRVRVDAVTDARSRAAGARP